MTAQAAFWVGPAAIAAVLGAVVFLYWLKPPPRRMVVPSNVIWERVLREGRIGSDRLRWWISLLLAAAIALAIAIAVLPGDRSRTGAPASRFAVVVDDSVTMATRTTDGATRLDHALRKARALIEARRADEEVWVADTMRQIAVPAFGKRDDALKVLASLRAQSGKLRGLPLPGERADAVVFTDGVSLETFPAGVTVQSVFEPVENAGIVAFDIRAVPSDGRRYVAYVEVANASGVDKRIELSMAGVGGKRIARILAVPRNDVRGETIDVSAFEGGPIRASIAMPGDGLALDDVAYASLPARKQRRVALVSAGNAFLAKALATLPRVKVTTLSPARYGNDAEYDAIVFDRFAPATQPRVPALVFRAPSASWLPPTRGKVADVSVSSWDGANPLLENVSLRDLVVDRGAVFDLDGRAAQGETVLASAPGRQPLIVASSRGARWIAFSFGVEESNFALHAGFPLFLGNALEWMLGGQPDVARGLGLVEIPLADARVIAADGTEVPVQDIPGGSLFEADAPGLYTAVSARGRVRVAANLLDRRATNVNASSLARFEATPGAQAAPAPRKGMDAMALLLVAAILLLVFEWWTWNRRLTT